MPASTIRELSPVPPDTAPDSLFLAGMAAVRTGCWVSGIEQLGRALFLDPDLPGGQNKFLAILQEAFTAAEACLAAGNKDGFIAIYVAILEARARAGCSYLLRPHLPLAVAPSLWHALERALGLVENRDDAGAQLLRPLAAFELGRVEEAEAVVTALVARSGSDPRLLRRIAGVVLHHKRSAMATALFRRILVAEPGDGEAWHGLGKALYTGHLAAVVALRRAVAIAPAGVAARIDLGAALLEVGETAAAASAFALAQALRPPLARARLGSAAAFALLKRPGAALEAFRQTTGLAPDLIEAHVGIGSLLIGHDPLGAVNAFATAIRLKQAQGLQLSSMPPVPGMYESMRGYADAMYRLLARLAAIRPGEVVSVASGLDGEAYAEMPVIVGRLSPLAAVPGDGRFHFRDPARRIATRRLAGAEAYPLSPPVNFCSEEAGAGERRAFYGNVIFDWLARAYDRFAWATAAPFPKYAGSDGTFLSRIDGCRLANGYVFSIAGDFFEESTLFDELVLFGRGQGHAGFVDREGGAIRFLTPSTRLPAPHVILTGYHALHYGSWLLNVAPKLLTLDAEEETRSLPIVVMHSLYDERRFVRETLAALGVAPERLVVAGNGTLEFERAWVVNTGAHILDRRGALALRRRLLQAFGASERPGGSRVFYISRRDADVRRVLNEDAMVAMLERFGVIVVTNAELAMGDIVTLFADARCVIGVNGAGMANILFCPPGTAVVEVASDLMIEPLYWMLSTTLGLRHAVLVERALNRKGDFVVDLDRLRETLERLLG